MDWIPKGSKNMGVYIHIESYSEEDMELEQKLLNFLEKGNMPKEECQVVLEFYKWENK